MKTAWIAGVVGLVAVLSGCMTAQAPKNPVYTAKLVPGAGIVSTGKGDASFTYDPATHTLSYSVTYGGLTGPAVAAHIHGPAQPGANGPPVIPFASPSSPIKGTAQLSDAQAADLAAGRYYVNVHTAANKGGEIRGQITPGM